MSTYHCVVEIEVEADDPQEATNVLSAALDNLVAGAITSFGITDVDTDPA